MKRWLLRAIVVAFAVLLLSYAGDSCAFRYRVFRGRNPFGEVVVRPLYAIREKGGKVEYQLADPETDVCVRSLYPHQGYRPCWYLSRHTEKRIDI